MKKYNFDEEVSRRGSGCIKHDGMMPFYGREDLLPLWIADMDFLVADEIADVLEKRAAHHVYGYSFAPDSYWESILLWERRRHGLTLYRDQITFIPGIVKGIGLVINFYTRPGDKIVIQPPVYHPFRRLIEGNDRVALCNPLVEDGDTYRMNLEEIEEIFRTEHPKMMILCNPHNPIGLQWDMPTLRRVAELAAKHGVIVVSDEIHGDLMLSGRDHIPYLCAGADAAATGIMFAAPSKTFNIPGLVSSWVAIKNPQLRDPFFHWLEVNELNAPTQYATLATEAAYTYGGEWLEQVVAYIEGNIDAMAEYIARELPTLKMYRPQASYLVWLDMRPLGLRGSALEKFLAEKAHLALNAGEMFGKEGDGCVRFNVALPRRKLLEALASLKRAIDELRDR